MKTLIASLLISSLILHSCNQRDEQISPAAQKSAESKSVLRTQAQSATTTSADSLGLVVSYVPQEPILIGLQSFLPSETYARYRINSAPAVGLAEIMNDVFLKYEPNGESNDHILIDLIDFNNKVIETRRISFQPSKAGCGIAQFDSYKIRSDETLSFDVLANDGICGRIENMLFVAHSIKLGMKFTVQPSQGATGTTRMIFTYSPPAGFKGKVSAIYTTGINRKAEFANLPGFVNHPEYYNFFASSLVEIEVVD